MYRALFRLMLHLNVKSFELNVAFIVVGKNNVFDQLQIVGDKLVIVNSTNGKYLNVSALRFKEILDILDEVTSLIVEVNVVNPTLYNPLDNR